MVTETATIHTMPEEVSLTFVCSIIWDILGSFGISSKLGFYRTLWAGVGHNPEDAVSPWEVVGHVGLQEVGENMQKVGENMQEEGWKDFRSYFGSISQQPPEGSGLQPKPKTKSRTPLPNIPTSQVVLLQQKQIFCICIFQSKIDLPTAIK